MLEVQNLSYSTKTFSMENVSFSLDDGYLMTLLGRNGVGKTTLFDLVYGRIEPLSGKVLWNDIDVKRRTWRICTGTDYIYDTAQRKM